MAKVTRRLDGVTGIDKAIISTLAMGDNIEVTATAAELNALDGITSTVTELNILDGVTADKDELNLLDGVAGLVQADLTKLAAVDASASELNILDGVTADKDELNLLDNQVASCSFVVSADVGNDVTVNVQFKDAAGVDMATPVSVDWYYSSDAAGLDPLATAHDGGTAVGTDGAIIENVADLSGRAVSENDGDLDFVATDAGAFTSYLVIVMPNGSLQISGVMTHDA